jgi:hypothetical protein
MTKRVINMTRKMFVFTGVLLFFFAQACNTQHEVTVAPVEVKPIHIIIDVNIKVDRALDNFFGDIDRAK